MRHSHTRRTLYPNSSAISVARSSRSRLRRIFSCHRAAFGPVKGVLRPCSGQPCQKQPSTKTASRCRGSRMSGVHPLASVTCFLNRSPTRCRADLRATSAAVSVFRRPVRCLPLAVLTQPAVTSSFPSLSPVRAHPNERLLVVAAGRENGRATVKGFPLPEDASSHMLQADDRIRVDLSL